MTYYFLFYDVVDDYLDRRTPHRHEHLGLAREARERGEMVMAGAYGDPVEGVALLFRCDDASVAERFAEADPYVRAGVVTGWRVAVWNEVLTG